MVPTGKGRKRKEHMIARCGPMCPKVIASVLTAYCSRADDSLRLDHVRKFVQTYEANKKWLQVH